MRIRTNGRLRTIEPARPPAWPGISLRRSRKPATAAFAKSGAGGQAAAEYYRMVFVETDWVERAEIREALLRYCARDTMALVELRKVLKEKAGE